VPLSAGLSWWAAVALAGALASAGIAQRGELGK